MKNFCDSGVDRMTTLARKAEQIRYCMMVRWVAERPAIKRGVSERYALWTIEQ
jgi:hypothetical protein